MYIAHTSDLFFSPVDSGYVMFALSSRDKKKQTKKTIAALIHPYCVVTMEQIKRQNWILKTFFLCALCSCVLVLVVVVVVFQLWWWCGFFVFF